MGYPEHTEAQWHTLSPVMPNLSKYEIPVNDSESRFLVKIKKPSTNPFYDLVTLPQTNSWLLTGSVMDILIENFNVNVPSLYALSSNDTTLSVSVGFSRLRSLLSSSFPSSLEEVEPKETKSADVSEITLQLFLFLFSLHAIFHVAAPATVSTFCPASDSNFTTNSTYQSNLNRLLSSLPEAGSATGFSLATQGQAPDQVFGRVLCRGDKSANYCLSCFRNASKEILTDCAPRERALIYYDDCILGYSDTNSTNSDEIWVFFNPNTVSDVQTFEDVYDNLMGSLTAKAANSS
ncbi:Cysteine-rich receptor-like protein kinase 15 [Carex littledalei]|uniref:Cysteine-rich receptor-like protein kinase 15 n=1 Tax=Carex littledalei TaxID=544730 RepID=A0A833QAA8_9POAL|nr:Cysteine-rich receptor-like protein kinase 15 [Carex littledalei]